MDFLIQSADYVVTSTGRTKTMARKPYMKPSLMKHSFSLQAVTAAGPVTLSKSE